MSYGVGIIGTGHALPARVETNEALCLALPQLTPDAIFERAGVRRRYLAGPEDSAASLAVAAARRAIADAGVAPERIGLVVCCTFTADYVFPPLSAKVAAELGASEAQVFDLQANCAGFVTGLTVASDRMRVDAEVELALVIGVELHTRVIDRADPDKAMSFSDGAGAALLGRVPAGSGVLASAFRTDASGYEAMRLTRERGTIEIDGAATWQPVIAQLPALVRRAAEKAGIEPAAIDLYVFHQANLSLIWYVMRKLGLPLDRTHTNLEEVGNTGAASPAIALSDAVARGRLRPGQTVLLAAAGAGLSFGASVWKWARP